MAIREATISRRVMHCTNCRNNTWYSTRTILKMVTYVISFNICIMQFSELMTVIMHSNFSTIYFNETLCEFTNHTTFYFLFNRGELLVSLKFQVN